MRWFGEAVPSAVECTAVRQQGHAACDRDCERPPASSQAQMPPPPLPTLPLPTPPTTPSTAGEQCVVERIVADVQDA
jgi:hypothetical protein